MSEPQHRSRFGLWFAITVLSLIILFVLLSEDTYFNNKIRPYEDRIRALEQKK